MRIIESYLLHIIINTYMYGQILSGKHVMEAITNAIMKKKIQAIRKISFYNFNDKA